MSRKNHLFLVLLTAASYSSSLHAQTLCVPTDICMSSSDGGSQQYRCDNGKAVLTAYTDDSCNDIIPFYVQRTNYTCSSTTPCTDYMYLRVYEEPPEPYPTWSWPENTEEGSCGTFVGATSYAYDIDYYNLTVTNYSTIIINSCSSTYDTYLYFLTADGDVIDECDDCGDCGVQTVLTVYNVAPGDYKIGIGGYSSDYGQYGVIVNCDDGYFLPETSYDGPDTTYSRPTWSTRNGPDNTGLDPTWSWPDNTEEGSCGTFVGATTYAYDVDYYDFTVTNFSTIIIDSCGSSYDTYLYFKTADGDTISQCDDCGDCGTRTILTVNNVVPGQYQIGIGGYSSSYGRYIVTVFCEDGVFMPQTTDDYPDNTYPNPTWSLPTRSYSTRDNPETTDVYPTWSWPDNTEEGSCGTFYGATTYEYDVDWYDFTVTNYSTIIIDSCGSSYDTYLYFKTADGVTIEECDDCGECGTRTILTVYNVAPGEYQIGIGGYSDDYGRYAVTVYCNEGMFIPQTTYDKDTDTDTNWFFGPTPDITYALNEEICDSDIYQETILPVGCQSYDDYTSQFYMCSFEGITIYYYRNGDCSGEPAAEQNYVEGCSVNRYGDTINLDIIQCMGVVDTTSTTEVTETTEEGSTTTENVVEETDAVDESGVDGVGWMLATVVMVGIMVFFE